MCAVITINARRRWQDVLLGKEMKEASETRSRDAQNVGQNGQPRVALTQIEPARSKTNVGKRG